MQTLKLDVHFSIKYFYYSLLILVFALISLNASAQTIQLAYNVDSNDSSFAGTYFSGAFHVSSADGLLTLTDGNRFDHVYLGTLSFDADENSFKKTYESFYQNIDRTYGISVNGGNYDYFPQVLPVGLVVGRDGSAGQYKVSNLQSMSWDTTFNLVNGGTLDIFGVPDNAVFDGLSGDTTIPLQASFVYHAPSIAFVPELPTYVNFIVGLLGVGSICLIKRSHNRFT